MGVFGVNGILTDTLLLVEGKIGVEVGFEVGHINEAPANGKSISLHQGGLRACQGRRSSFLYRIGWTCRTYILPFYKGFDHRTVIYDSRCMGKLLSDYIDDA